MTWVVVLAVGAGRLVFRLGLLQRISLVGRADRVIRDAGNAAITAFYRRVDQGWRRREGRQRRRCWQGRGLVLAARGFSMLRLVVWEGGICACSPLVVDLLAR